MKRLLRRILRPDPDYTGWIRKWETANPAPVPQRTDWPVIRVVVEGGEASVATLASLRAQKWKATGDDGEYIAAVGAGDELHPDALSVVADAIQRTGAAAVYSDEDHLDADGRRVRPLLKPDWSPSLRSPNYPGNLRVVKAGVDEPDEWIHIRRVLYHRRLA